MVKVILHEMERVFADGTRVGPVNLEVRDGELLTLLGASGSGKTTTLRMVAGFIEPEHGTLTFDDADVTNMHPRERGIGMVFQSVALFPNMTVFQNIAFGPAMDGWNREQVLGRVEELADLLDIRKLLHRHVREISGGEAQRVALARALAKEPRLLLLDEPLSALDPHLRERLQSEIRRVQKSLGITTIYVTHSQEEAFAISDRIAVLSDGVVLQVGTPHELYSNPSNEIVARFIGDGNIIRGRVIESSDESLLVDVNGYSFSLAGEAQVGASVLFSVKPEQVILEPDVKQKLGMGKVISVTPSVGLYKVELVFAEYHISSIVYDKKKAEVLMQKVNSEVGVSFAPGSVVVLQIDD